MGNFPLVHFGLFAIQVVELNEWLQTGVVRGGARGIFTGTITTMSPYSSFGFELSRTARTGEETILITDHRVALQFGRGFAGKLSIRGFESVKLTILPVCWTSFTNGFPGILDGSSRGSVLISSKRGPVKRVSSSVTLYKSLIGSLMLSSVDVLNIKKNEKSNTYKCVLKCIVPKSKKI